MTAFVFVLSVVLSVLVVVVLILFLRSRAERSARDDYTPNDLKYPGSNNGRESIKEGSFHLPLAFSLFTGIVAIVTNYAAYVVLEPFGSRGICSCPAVPAGLLGILGGYTWYKIKNRSDLVPFDIIPSSLIGFGAGLITYYFLDLVYLVFYIAVGGQ